MAACGGGGGSATVPTVQSSAAALATPAGALSAQAFQALRPSAPNPASIPAQPMAKPSDDLQRFLSSTPADRSKLALGSLNFSQIPGAASQAAYGSDGSLYVLSTAPSGSTDKYIYRFYQNVWTQLPGVASRLAPAPNGTLWVINTSGQLYNYSSTTGAFTGFGGQSQDVAVDLANNVYVISKTGAADGAIYKNTNGVWAQLGGAGAHLASQPDTSLYVLTSTGAIYNTPTSSLSYTACPGTSSRIVPLANGAGFFALGYPTNTVNGSPIFQFTPTVAGNCGSGSYAQLNGSGVDFAGTSSNLAVISSSGGIYVAATGTTTTGGPTSATSPLPGATAAANNSTFAITSNPSGLPVKLDGVSVGTTPTSITPALSSSSGSHTDPVHTVQIGSKYTQTIVQQQDGNHTLFYNQAADTNGTIFASSIKSVGRAVATVAVKSTLPQTLIRRSPKSTRGRKGISTARIFVTYKPALSTASTRRAASSNVESFERTTGTDIVDNATAGLTRAVAIPKGETVDSFSQKMLSHSEVASVSPVHLRYAFSTTALSPNNKHFAADQQWYLFQTGVPNAWAYTKGDGITIAVIDTGFDATSQNLVPKVTFTESIVTDQTTGVTAIDTSSNAAQDTDGHGTNVTSLAASVNNNGAGWASVGWNVNLMPIRIFPQVTPANYALGGPSADSGDEARAIYDVVAKGADVISLSLGGYPDSGADPVELAAVEYAISQGVVVVAADGNEGPGVPPDFPAGYPGVIRVGASSLNDNSTGIPAASNTELIASYSNDYPTIVAPGGDPSSNSDNDLLHWIYNASTTTGGVTDDQCLNNSDCGFLFAGTSQATPQVSGAVALALAAHGGKRSITPAQMATYLQSTADAVPNANTIRQGAGRLNTYRLLASIVGDTALPTYVPAAQQFRVFAYTNSGGTTPKIVDVNAASGIFAGSGGTFEIADVPTTVGAYKIGVWYNAAGNGVISPGDLFGASGTCSATAVCTSAASISVSRVTAGFTLP